MSKILNKFGFESNQNQIDELAKQMRMLKERVYSLEKVIIKAGIVKEVNQEQPDLTVKEYIGYGIFHSQDYVVVNRKKSK